MKSFVFAILISLSVLLAGCLGNSDSYDFNAQLKSDTTLISTYVELFAPNAIKIPSGVWYEIDTVGTGYFPSYQDTISVIYTGKLLATGANFEKRTTPVDFGLANLISGWQIGLPKFREGSYGKLYVPSGLAYGNSGMSTVPANSNLLFEIKVSKVSGYKTKQNLAAIDKYITDNNITNIIQDDSGIRYTIDTQSSGAPPAVDDYVTITYTGKLLASPSTTFATVATETEYYLPGLINAWSILLPKIPVGTTFTMYVPSGLAFDVFSNVQNVPANSNLIFQVHLISSRH